MTGALVYTPDSSYVGSDGFDFRATDLAGAAVIGHAGVTVKPLADLELMVDISRLKLKPGKRTTFKFDLMNRGPSPATDVMLEQILGDAFVVETAVSSQGDCAVALGTLRCAIGTIPVGTHVTGVWVETLPQAGVALFRATAIAPEDDPEPAERVVEAEITVQPK